MPLDIDRLEKVKPQGGGVYIARCPACAAEGRDHAGNHLKVFSDGRYGCVLNPGPEGADHRKLIFKLAGEPSK